MSVRFSDAEITDLLAETKPLPSDYRARFVPQPKAGHKERELTVFGAKGREFQIRIRQSNVNALDFSVVLLHRPAGTNVQFRVRRYNGRSHMHTNRIEGDRFDDFHVHTATERYQVADLREDGYAQPTSGYSDLAGALERLIEECGFNVPRDPQGHLFDGMT